MQYLLDIPKNKIKDKVFIVRVDLNISFSDHNSYRIDSILPTMDFILKNKGIVVLLSHRGRPEPMDNEGHLTELAKKETLRPLAGILSKKINRDVKFLPHSFFFGRDHYSFIKNGPERIFLFENLRFFNGEENNSAQFAKTLASFGDYYINDAFAVCHRKHASVVAITKYIPSFCGLSLQNEISRLNLAVSSEDHPFVVIIGGAKVSDKIGCIQNLWNKADKFLFGGGVANTFFAAKGFPIGQSLYEEKMLAFSKKYSDLSKIILPEDLKTENDRILDIGLNTVLKYCSYVKHAKTVIWSGPVGLFQREEFSYGTKMIWKAIADNKTANIIVGGGETVESMNLIKPIKLGKNIFVSTGGGAMLKFLSAKKLPGIESLK